MSSTHKEFRGKLVAVENHWTCMEIPFDVEKGFGSRARVAVRGTLNGFPYRSSIFPDGKGKHFMLVNKQMQAGAGVKQGDRVRVVMELDNAPRTVTVPAELKRALAAKPATKAGFDKLAYSHRKQYVEFVTGAKQPETRARRAAKVVAMVAAGKVM